MDPFPLLFAAAVVFGGAFVRVPYYAFDHPGDPNLDSERVAKRRDAKALG